MSTSKISSSPFSSDDSTHVNADARVHTCFLTRYYTDKVLNVADIKYEESYMRTPMPDVRWVRGNDEEAVIGGWEVEEAEVVLESIETSDEMFGKGQGQGEEGDVWGNGKREWSPLNMSKKRGFIEDDDEDEVSPRKKPKTRKPTS